MLKLKDIVELGIRPDHSSYLKRKIKLSNQISFIFVSYLFILNIIFLALNLTNYLYLGVIVGLLYVIPLVLSYFNSPRVGRFIISILPSIGILSSHASILGNEEEPVTSILILQFSVIVMPWILFNVREKIALPVSLIITSAMFFLFPVVNPLLDFNFDSAVIREPFFDVFIKLSSCIILFIILFILQQDSMESEQNNLLLIKEMKEQQNLLHANEYKLNEYIKEIEKAKEEDKIRQWRADGIARFNEMIRRNNQDTQKLYDEIITEMVKHNGANQGGLFILNESGEDEPFLEMSACYAYERSKYVDKKIYISEGLLGQAFQDKEPLLLTEVPQNYIHITSGLGKALPRCVLIVPLKYNEQICGMIELASFYVFLPHHIEFVRRVGEIIASAILSAQINEKTQRLLRETQEQAEQMRAQEEEVRQNMEELHATQEEMQRKQQELEASNRRMSNGEQILKKTLEKLKEQEKQQKQLLEEAEQRNKDYYQSQQLLRTQLTELQENEAKYLDKIAELENRLK